VLGGTFPASIWSLFMSQALASTPVTDFPPAPSFDEGASAGSLPSYVGQPADEAAKAWLRKGVPVAKVDRYSVAFPPGLVAGLRPVTARAWHSLPGPVAS